MRIGESGHDVSLLRLRVGGRGRPERRGHLRRWRWSPDVDQSGLGTWAEKEGRAGVEAQEWILGAPKGDPEGRA